MPKFASFMCIPILSVWKMWYLSWRCSEYGCVTSATNSGNSSKSVAGLSTEQCYPTVCLRRTNLFILVESLVPPKFLPISSTPQPERRQPPQRRHSIEKETPTNVRQFLPPSKQSSRSLVSGVGGRREKKRQAKSIMKIKTWLQWLELDSKKTPQFRNIPWLLKTFWNQDLNFVSLAYLSEIPGTGASENICTLIRTLGKATCLDFISECYQTRWTSPYWFSIWIETIPEQWIYFGIWGNF